MTSKEEILGPPTKADAAYIELRNQILQGILAPGSRVDHEYLTELFGLSTTPLREALRRLEADHLVIRQAHRGVMIAPFTRAEALDLLIVREDLDALAVRLAAEHMTAEELNVAVRMLREQDDAWAVGYLRSAHVPVSVGGQLTVGRAFHRMVYCGSHNAVLIQCRDAISARTERYAIRARELRPSREDANDPHYEALIAALGDHDADKAEQVLRILYRQDGFNFAETIFGGNEAFSGDADNGPSTRNGSEQS